MFSVDVGDSLRDSGDELSQLLRTQTGILGADLQLQAGTEPDMAPDLDGADLLRPLRDRDRPALQPLADAFQRQASSGPLADLQQLVEVVAVIPGTALLAMRPVDQALLDDFGRLILGQPNRFRELAKR